MSESFLDQFELARQEVDRLRETMPHLFPEWQRVQRAAQRELEAVAELKASIVAWHNTRSDKR